MGTFPATSRLSIGSCWRSCGPSDRGGFGFAPAAPPGLYRARAIRGSQMPSPLAYVLPPLGAQSHPSGAHRPTPPPPTVSEQWALGPELAAWKAAGAGVDHDAPDARDADFPTLAEPARENLGFRAY